MHTDYRDFEYFDFHDSYFQGVEVDNNNLIWYLEAVNVLNSCSQNPHKCSMRASEMRLQFIDYEINSKDFPLDKLAEDSYEILSAEKTCELNGKYTYLFNIYSFGEYIELEMSFSDVLIEWKTYEDKAWYAYCNELEFTKKFLLKNPQIKWFPLNSRQNKIFVDELHNELSESHPLYRTESVAYAKAENSDDILFGLSNGKCAIIHMTCSNRNTDDYPKIIEFESVEEALESIKTFERI